MGNWLKKPEIKSTILVVEDDAAFARVCTSVLKNDGYQVLNASDGSAGLRTLALSKVDLVLLDIFMPEKDGFETLATLRRHHPTLPVIAMSGGGLVTTPQDVLDQCQHLGVAAMLAKPFTDEELLRAVADALRPKPPAG